MVRTVFLSFLLLLSISSMTALAQKSFHFDGIHAVDVGDDQYAKLNKIVNRLPFDEEVNQLEKTIASSKRRLDQRLIEHKKQLESILMPDQLKELNAKRKAKTQQSAKMHADFMVRFAVFLTAFSKAEEMKVYEGIPWAVSKEFKEDEPSPNAINFGGALFYEEALPVQSTLLEQLRSEIVEYQSYQPFNSEKWGLGKTPDFCVVWQDKKETHCAHIYLWGNELVYFGPGTQLKFDFIFTTRQKWMKFAATALVKHQDKFKKVYGKIK